MTILKNTLAAILGALGFTLTLLGADAGNTLSGWWGVLGVALFLASALLGGTFSKQ